MIEIELFNPLTMFKQMTDVNWINSDTQQYLEPFNFVDLCLTELFEIELFDHLTVCKEMIDV